MYEKINEPVKTLVSFGGGKALLRSFTWRGRIYGISGTTLTYEQQEGSVNRRYFSVVSGGALYKLYFDPKRLLWILEEIYVE